jgi:hypothetical protein
VSVSWTGPDGQSVGPGGSPGTTTTVESDVPTVAGSPATSPSASAVSGESASVQETIAVSVLPGPMTVSPTSESIGFTPSGANGQRGSYGGDLSPITVVEPGAAWSVGPPP